jgi:hypothetical protein
MVWFSRRHEDMQVVAEAQDLNLYPLITFDSSMYRTTIYRNMHESHAGAHQA